MEKIQKLSIEALTKAIRLHTHWSAIPLSENMISINGTVFTFTGKLAKSSLASVRFEKITDFFYSMQLERGFYLNAKQIYGICKSYEQLKKTIDNNGIQERKIRKPQRTA